MSDLIAVATLESFLITHADNGQYHIDMEEYKLGLSPSERKSVGDYQALVAIEHRVLTHGIGLEDVAALESVAPGTLSHAMPVDGFSFKPSMQNVEYALERINLAKLSAMISVGASIVKFAKWVIEYVKKRIQQFKDKRALAASKKLMDNLKEYRDPQAKNKQNGLSRDTTQIPKPGGASHDSQVKRPATATDPQINIYKDIWVRRFGLSEKYYSSYVACKSVKELGQFLGRTDLEGPAIYANSPNVDVNVLLEFISQTTNVMDKLADQQRNVLRQIDGAIAGNADSLDLSFDIVITPLQSLSANLGNRDIKRQIDDAATRLDNWTRIVDMKGSLLLQRIDIIPDILNKLVEDFSGEKIVATMDKYTGDYERVTKQIQLKIEQYAKSTPQGSQSETIIQQVNQYNEMMSQLISLYRTAVLSYGNITDYLSSFASAINIFMEN